MILHIIQYEKFTADYIEKINRLFDPREHLFFVHGAKAVDNIKNIAADNIVFSNQYPSKRKIARALFHFMKKSDKIILHSIFCPSFLFLTLISYIPFGGKKYFWNIWGADLYDAYRKRKNSIGLRIKELLRRYFIRHVPAVGYIPGDYDFLKAHYKTKAKFISAPYSYDFIDIPSGDKGDAVNILIGNSATETCQHKEAVDMLTPYKDRNIKVYCVLSYPQGKNAYRDDIIVYGKKALGDKFLPLTDYMAYEAYVKLLSSIDIAIFNHDRQQALGNIVNLLFYGKRVFVNPMNACGDYCKRMGATVYSTDELGDDDIRKKDISELKEKNQAAILAYFSDENYHAMWNAVFES